MVGFSSVTNPKLRASRAYGRQPSRFLSEATRLVASRAHFLAKPVSLPQGLPSRAECEQILQVYRQGKILSVCSRFG